MRIGWRFVGILFFLCISFVNLSAEKNSLNIISPQNYSLQKELSVNIVVDTKGREIEHIEIFSPVQELTIDVNSSRTTYCKNISLTLGKNIIIFRLYKNKKERFFSEIRRYVYVELELKQRFKFPPKRYKKNFFHTDEKEAQCKKCHDMTLNERKDIAFIDVSESNCYSCHKNLLKEKYEHAPAANWLCTSCHDGSSGIDNAKDAKKSKYLAPEPIADTCFKCHKKTKALWDGYRYKHDPLDNGKCNKCHNPHASPYINFVREPSDQICLGCHNDKRVNLHQQMNDLECPGTSGAKSCIVCHSPHASDEAFFIKKIQNKEKE